MSAPGDIYELAITQRSIGTTNITVNVFHFRAVTSGCTATSLIADFRSGIESSWRTSHTSDAILERYLAFNLIPYNTDVAEQRTTLPGLNGAIPLPYVVSAIVTWRTALLGRQNRGRTYFGSVLQTDVVNGQITGYNSTSKYQALAQSMLNRYGATGTSPDIRMGVWSRVKGNQTPPHNAAGFTQISSFSVQQNVGSMGTRRRGRGV